MQLSLVTGEGVITKQLNYLTSLKHISPRNSTCTTYNIKKKPLNSNKISESSYLINNKNIKNNNNNNNNNDNKNEINSIFPFQNNSKFKMAHESFRIRMFQEQYNPYSTMIEPVRFVLIN